MIDVRKWVEEVEAVINQETTETLNAFLKENPPYILDMGEKGTFNTCNFCFESSIIEPTKLADAVYIKGDISIVSPNENEYLLAA